MLLVPSVASATHMAGAEIYWECVDINTGTYRISLVVYRDCNGNSLDATYDLNIASTCGNMQVNVARTSWREVSQLCGAQLPNSRCQPGGTQPGMQEHIYSAVVTGLTPCNAWHITWDEQYRNNAITNLTNPGGTNMFVEAVINNVDGACNDSPRMTNVAVPYVCVGQQVSYSYGAYDPEADSLSFTLVSARGEDGDAAGYPGAYTPTVPIPGLVLNPINGLLTFTAPGQGNYVVVVRVDEFDDQGNWIGSVLRDMQFIVRPCTNIAPDPATGTIGTITGDAVQTGPYALTVCESGDFCATMVVTDANAANILQATSNIAQNLPGATISTTGTNPLTIRVCWTAAAGTEGFFPFIVTVSDGACPIPAFQTYVYSVTVLPGLHMSVAATDETCAGLTNGTAQVQVSVGLPPYTYAWNTGAATAGITAGAGTYSVTVTDANGCVNSNNAVTIAAAQQPPTADAGYDIFGCMADLPVSLSGTATNAASVQWSGGAGTFTGTGGNVTYMPTHAEVMAGGLELTFTAQGLGACPPATDQTLLILPNSFHNAHVTTTPVTCPGGTDGTATFTPDDPSLFYLWSPGGQSAAVATGLAAGPYTLTVFDSFGCDTTINVTITQPPAFVVSQLPVSPEQCAGLADGTATITVTGGTQPYTYAWSNGVLQPGITAGAGIYTVEVTDHRGCTLDSTIAIVALGQPNHANAGPDLVGCYAALPVDLTGQVVNATGGTWSGGTGTWTGTGINVSYMPTMAEILSGGVDLVLSTTGNSTCAVDHDTVHVALSSTFFGTAVSVTDVRCADGSDGVAAFGPVTSGSTFQWDDVLLQTTATATGLVAGTYHLTVTDALGCDTAFSVLVDEPALLAITSVDVTAEQCAGQADGSLTVQVTGGVEPYGYGWSNGATDATIHVGGGAYTVVVTDAHGCSVTSASTTVAVLGQPNVAFAGPDLVGCYGALPVPLAGTVVNATGGTWSHGNGTFTGTWPTLHYMPTMAEVLSGGVDLVLTTTGNTTCPTAQDTVHIALSSSFINSAISTVDVLCNGDATGSAAFTPADPTFNYQWTDAAAQTTAQAHDLLAGVYQLTVTDILGCDSTYTVTIVQPTALVMGNMVTVDPSCPGGTNGSATAVVTGGVPQYTFSWSENANGQSAQTITAVGDGSYVVTVTDANGCTANATGILTAPPTLILSAQVPDTVCVNAPVQMTAQASGGTAPLYVHWTGIGTGDTLQYQFAASTNVVVQLTDGAGCTGPSLTFPVHVLDLSLATLTTSGDTVICPGGQALLSAAVQQYAGSVQYQWTPIGVAGPGPHSVQPTQDGSYMVVATDACGSMISAAVPVDIQFPPNVQLPAIIAEGCAPLAVQIPGGLTTEPVMYHWNYGDGTTGVGPTPVHTYGAGQYEVVLTMTTPIGCVGQAQTTGQVIVHGLPTAAFNASAWTANFDAANIHFTDQSTGPSAITGQIWSFGDGGTGTGPDLHHQYTDVGQYLVQLTVEDEHGCTSSVTHPLTITPVYDFVVPNAFTPNPAGGNGGAYDPTDLSNDVFYPFIRFVKEFNMSIYNRWGELVFESDDIRRGWDGYYRGQLSQQDVYAYRMRVRFVDDKEVLHLGDITLFR